ncbi:MULTISPECIES: hypothetical protein [Staphylococcaceae]|uniref:Uncharacterized protein n=1 Tax=Macrococcoides canis TaxID=1855823 RepID=A0A4Y1NN39_9STAP|nr:MULTISPECIES: hypothetical protein [Staphylococcaceae]AXE75032.1 hypothetical protein [Macrococcus canis]
MKNVEDYMQWRTSEGKSFEDIFNREMNILGWTYRDVLYSFLGIYVLGIYVYYEEDINKKKTRLEFKDGSQLWNFEKIYKLYDKYEELNNLQEIKSFLSVYGSIGNIIPMWPGGNVHKGSCNYYDLTEIYFNNFKNWRDYLVLEYPNACLEEIVDRSEKYNMKEFMDKLDKDFYKKYLKEITQVIKNREEEIKKQLHN